jgi:CheY-like chemotaxis protein
MTETPKTKILLVDDDKFLLDMYALKFKTKGLEVDTMSSSASVLSKLKEGYTTDILLLDIIMPGMDGLSLLETIRKEKLIPDTTIIMLTNQADDMERAKQLGVDGFIIKAMTIPSGVVDQVISIHEQRNKK